MPDTGSKTQAIADKSSSNAENTGRGGIGMPARENNTGMPDQLKSGLENISGMDLSDVKVNYNSDKPAQLNAHAYAQGNEINMAPGQEKHLPHEGWHVVQQRQGRVKPTMQMKGNIPVNDDAGLEKEADDVGAKAQELVSGDIDKNELHTEGSERTTIQKMSVFPGVVQKTPQQARDFIMRPSRFSVNEETANNLSPENIKAYLLGLYGVKDLREGSSEMNRYKLFISLWDEGVEKNAEFIASDSKSDKESRPSKVIDVPSSVKTSLSAPSAVDKSAARPEKKEDGYEKEIVMKNFLGGFFNEYDSQKKIEDHFTGSTEQEAADFKAVPVLKDKFGSNWFKAKDLLLKSKASEVITPLGKTLMKGLHGLRLKDMDVTYKAVRDDLKEKQKSLAEQEERKEKLRAEKRKLNEAKSEENSIKKISEKKELEEYITAGIEDLKKMQTKALLTWGSAGSTSLTSDIDSNPKGVYSVLVVKAFNDAFKNDPKNQRGFTWPFEAGTVYDINIYAQDYMADWPPFDLTPMPIDAATTEDVARGMTMHQEVELSKENFKKFDEHQEMMSITHILKYIDHGHALDYLIQERKPQLFENKDDLLPGKEWVAYKDNLLEGKIKKKGRRFDKDPFVQIVENAEAKYIEFRTEILMKKLEYNEHALKNKGDFSGIAKGIKESFGEKKRERGDIYDEDKHDKEHQQNIIEMAVANRIYEAKLENVQNIRKEYTEKLVSEEDKASIEATGLALKAALAEAVFFANEVYMTQGAVQFAVLFKQTGGKDLAAWQDEKNMAHIKASRGEEGVGKVTLDPLLEKELFLHSFNENVGDCLKVLNEIHGVKDYPDFKKDLLKVAKYSDRMLESAKYLLGEELLENTFTEVENAKYLMELSEIAADIKSKEGILETSKHENLNKGGGKDERERLLNRYREDSYGGAKGKIATQQVKLDHLMAGRKISSVGQLKTIILNLGIRVPRGFKKFKHDIMDKESTLSKPAGQIAKEQKGGTSMAQYIAKQEEIAEKANQLKEINAKLLKMADVAKTQ